MATGLLNINPYYKGVNLDFTSKPTQLAIQLQQKEQAKAEALEKYFMDYEKSINPAGLGTGEGKVFTDKYNKVREYWMKNKEAILHPAKYGYDAQSTLMAGYKDLTGYIDQAKQATAERKAFKTYIDQARKSGKHISDNYLNVMENAMKPVGAGYEAPDTMSIDIYDPHDPMRFGQKLDVLLKRTEGAPIKQFIPGSKTEYQWVTPKEINKDEARSVALNELQDKGYREYITNISKDLSYVKGLNKIYKERTGKDIPVEVVNGKPEVNLAELSYANVLSQVPTIYDRSNPELTESEKTRLALARQKSTTPIGAMPEGNLFDQIPDVKLGSGGQISNGVAYDSKNTPLNGKVYLKKEELPSEWFSVIGNPKNVKGFEVEFKDGSPERITNPKFGSITRQSMLNYQRKYDTEPKNAPKLDFSKGSKYTATGAGGVKIYSQDGVNWFNKEGKKIQ